MDKIKEAYDVEGFSVRFSQKLVELAEPGSTLIFDHVISNVNNCYDPTTGVFTAPKTGIYSFYVSGVAGTDDVHDFVDLIIKRRQNINYPFRPLARVFLKPLGDFLLGCQGSSSVRLKMEKGEQVSVKHIQGDLILKGGRCTTFSGVLEYEYPNSP